MAMLLPALRSNLLADVVLIVPLKIAFYIHDTGGIHCNRIVGREVEFAAELSNSALRRSCRGSDVGTTVTLYVSPSS